MHRVFIALKIPDDIKDKIEALYPNITSDYKNFRWEAKDKLHLTLKFIGDVDNLTLEEIKKLIANVSDFDGFNCQISCFNFFYRNRIPKILYLQLYLQPDINFLIKHLEKVLSQYLKEEKKEFKPHLSLLRIKNNINNEFINKFENYNFEPITFNANEIVLYRSILKPYGSIYEEIKKINLKMERL